MPTVRETIAVLAGLLTTAITAPSTAAQADAKPSASPVKLSDYPPNIRLGLRAASVQGKIPAADTVVVVPNESAYVAAIARWSPQLQFPVFIDDGSWEARRAIARFVRAYRPAHVVRWPGSAIEPSEQEDAAAAPPPLPATATERRAAIESALASAWQTPAGEHVEERFKAIGLTPPGVVVMNERDPAWTAGLALAAGRGQPIVWAGVPDGGGPSGWCSPDAAAALAEQIAAACDTLGYEWKALGDELDAVTLCINAPVKVFFGQDDRQGRSMLALTDVIGRFKADKTPDGKPDYTTRWAWAGQVFGSSPRAAADAMSALFLTPGTAWLFDGYPDTDPWNTYDATKAAEPLKKLGWGCVVDDAGGQGVDDWRWRAAGGRNPAVRGSEAPPRMMGIDAGLIAINSKGEGGWFELSPGIARSADVPMLRRPSMVYMVHSWSATAPSKRESIAARFIEHGAYAYCGSVHEPYLQGFVPTPAFTTRFAAGLPWGAAVRFDDGPAWKIALIGDPLITVRPARTRAQTTPPLQGEPIDLAEQVAALGKDKDYAGMLWTLAMLGRDEDAARLARALLKDQPDAVTSEAALAGAMSVFLQGDTATLVALLDRCKSRQADVPMLADMAWQALYPVSKALTDPERRLLAASLRPDNAARDARELAPQVEQADGRTARDELLVRARGMAIYESDKKDLEALLRE